MIRTAIALLLSLLASATWAEDCPDFYRFVDFGTIDASGITYRGGPLVRAETFDETRILNEAETRCLSVWPTLTDGRGNPIPIVSRIAFNPTIAGADLSIKAVPNASVIAQAKAELHRSLLGLTDSGEAEITTGPTFLCVATLNRPVVSCQVISPYSTTIPLTVTCGPENCDMPALVVHDRLLVSASWPTTPDDIDDLDELGHEISAKIDQIAVFLEPLSAAF